VSATNNIPNNVIINQDGDTVISITQDAPNNVLIHEDTPNRVTVNQDEPNRIVLALGGSIATNNLTRRHVHTQNTPSTTWTITHALGGKPQVTVVDTGDNVVHGDVQYLSSTQIVCSFSSAFSGFAYLT
jgi:hypothetical protein